MSLFDKLQKLCDIVIDPIRVITDFAREPLREWEHERQKDREVHVAKTASELKMKEDEAGAKIDAERLKVASVLKMEEKEATAQMEAERLKLEADIAIKKKTEVKRILVEIDELKKDKEFARMKAVSDAIMQYQEHLTKLNVNAIGAIGAMQLDLREKAQNLVYEKTIKYKELQDSAHAQAMQELISIEEKFGGNEAAKSIMYSSVDRRLAGMISTAQNFLLELNNDIAVLNKSINLLTEKGQLFIEDHLKNFHIVTNGGLLLEAQPQSEIPLLKDI